MSETFLLITGAWHGEWAWRPVGRRLQAAGHRVFALTLPGLRYADDPGAYQMTDVIDSVVGLIDAHDLHGVTVVAHSWGGYVLAGAVPSIADRLRRLVFLNAFVPAEGRSLMDEAPSQYQDVFRALAQASPDNRVLPPFELWQAGFMQDASNDAQQIVYELLVPHPMQYISEAVTPIDPVTLGVPVTYLLGTDDVIAGEFGYECFAERLGVRPTPVPGSHEALLTRPAEIAECLLAGSSELTGTGNYDTMVVESGG